MGSETDLAIFISVAVVFALLSGAGTAVEALSLVRLARSEDDDVDETPVFNRLLDDPVRNGIAIDLVRSFAAAGVVWALMHVLRDWHLQNSSLDAAARAGLVVGTLLISIMVGRVVSLRAPEVYLQRLSWFINPIVYLARPAAYVLESTVRRISPKLNRQLSFEFVPLREKIELFGTTNGDDNDDEQKMMSSLLDFGDTRVHEVMVPRIDIVAVNALADKEETISTVISAGHSRIPVYEETIDRIVGMLFTKDLLRKVASGEDFTIAQLARDAFFVPETKKIDELLSEFRGRRQHMAIVVDEYGGTAGIVTLEDVLEEIVGEIQDEFDAEEELIKRVDDDTVVCNAKVHLDELGEHLGIVFGESSSDSLGGFLFETIGRVPTPGETVEYGGLKFKVQGVQRQRIKNVTITGLASLAERLEDSTG